MVATELSRAVRVKCTPEFEVFILKTKTKTQNIKYLTDKLFYSYVERTIF